MTDITEYEFLKLAVRLRCAYIRTDTYDKLDTKHLDIFECVKEVFKGYQDVRTRMLEYKLSEQKIEENELLNSDLYEYFNVRICNILKSNGIKNIKQLIEYDDYLYKFPGFGKKCFNEVRDTLDILGLKLKH